MSKRDVGKRFTRRAVVAVNTDGSGLITRLNPLDHLTGDAIERRKEAAIDVLERASIPARAILREHPAAACCATM